MVMLESCKARYEKHKRLYNTAGIVLLIVCVATITHGVVKRNCVPRLLDVVDRPGTESTNSFSFFFRGVWGDLDENIHFQFRAGRS